MGPLRVLPLLLWAAAGCGAAMPDVRLMPPEEEVRPPRVDVKLTAPDDQQTVTRLRDATLLVILSPEFRRNLEAFGELWLTPVGKTAPSRQIAATYLGSGPLRLLDTTIVWDSKHGELANTSIDSATTATVHLGSIAIGRMKRDTVRSRSCAINTLAHELTHTIPSQAGATSSLYTDFGFHWIVGLQRPLVSYTIGAIAQCTYRRMNHLIADGDVRACVEATGTKRFNAGDCDAN